MMYILFMGTMIVTIFCAFSLEGMEEKSLGKPYALTKIITSRILPRFILTPCDQTEKMPEQYEISIPDVPDDPYIFLADGFFELQKKAFVWIAKLASVNANLEGQIITLRWSSKGDRVLAGCRKRQEHIVDAQSGVRICSQRWQRDLFTSINKDKSLYAIGHYDRSARIFDFKTQKEIFKFEHSNWVLAVAFNPKGTQLAAGCFDAKVYIIDIQKRIKLFEISYPKSVWGVSFNNTGTQLATGCSDSFVRVFDLEKNKLAYLISHPNRVEAVSFSPDGNFLATGCDDHYVRIFDILHAQHTTHRLTLSQYCLLQAFACAAIDSQNLASKRPFKRARIHANKKIWNLWESLIPILHYRAVERLTRYIVRDFSCDEAGA